MPSRERRARGANINPAFVGHLHYEFQSDHPPTKLLPFLVDVLGVSADQFLGVRPAKHTRTPDGRLWRRFKQIEELPPTQRRQLLQIVDSFLERERLRKKTG